VVGIGRNRAGHRVSRQPPWAATKSGRRGVIPPIWTGPRRTCPQWGNGRSWTGPAVSDVVQEWPHQITMRLSGSSLGPFDSSPVDEFGRDGYTDRLIVSTASGIVGIWHRLGKTGRCTIDSLSDVFGIGENSRILVRFFLDIGLLDGLAIGA
jgi:hypothetical protein